MLRGRVTSGRTSEYNSPQFPVEWGAPPPEVAEAGNGMFSVLYSDIGEKFYEKTGPGIEKAGGWETRSPISTIWEIPRKADVQQSSIDNKWTWLKYDDLDTPWAKDVQFIRRTMENLPESNPDYHNERPTAFVTYLPDEGVGSFHVFRSMFAADSIVSMDIWGVEKKPTDSASDRPTHAMWSIDVRPLPPTLIVTRISAAESEFPDLLSHIQEAARKSGIGKMEIWNIPKHLLQIATETASQTFERKEKLSAIKWYSAARAWSFTSEMHVIGSVSEQKKPSNESMYPKSPDCSGGCFFCHRVTVAGETRLEAAIMPVEPRPQPSTMGFKHKRAETLKQDAPIKACENPKSQMPRFLQTQQNRVGGDGS
ncbi:hypothetical protein J3R82DRAFT_1136 [Butyriboletus roseoflavus]|nr:hypothetical protein J3R82DRAFT_1136 [Butyriboletus roseoflavus]